MSRTISPIKDRVLVRQEPAQERVGKEQLIFAPQGSEAWPALGTIVACGPSVQAAELQPGVRIAFERKPSSAVVPDSREGDPENECALLMLPESHILGVVED